MIKEKYQNYTLLKASVDFHRHNEIKGLAQDSMKTYRGYVSKFIEWCGNDTLVADVTTDLLEEYAEYKMECILFRRSIACSSCCTVCRKV